MSSVEEVDGRIPVCDEGGLKTKSRQQFNLEWEERGEGGRREGKGGGRREGKEEGGKSRGRKKEVE